MPKREDDPRSYSIVVKDDYDNIMRVIPQDSLSDAIDMVTDLLVSFVKQREREKVWIAVMPTDEIEDEL